MSTHISLTEAIEAIYTSIHGGNADIDTHILNLREALKAQGLKEARFDPARLAENNRQGRKLMESYFKKRGVIVVFEKPA